MPHSSSRISDQPNQYVKAFWDKTSAEGRVCELDRLREREKSTPFERTFWSLIGDIRGLSVLEVGCGLGDDTLRYASKGAHVTSIDISSVAAERVRNRLSAAGLNAEILVMDAFELRNLDGRFDLIVGRYILHHLEPFGDICAILAKRLNRGGRMVFAENNARNPFLLLARRHLAGKYGIPKYGDNVEHPLTSEEVSLLSRYFGEVKCYFPSLVFLRKLNSYIFRHKAVFRPITWLIGKADDTMWYLLPALRPLSYVQIVTASKPLEF